MSDVKAEVLRRHAAGEQPVDIARALGISKDSARGHIRRAAEAASIASRPSAPVAVSERVMRDFAESSKDAQIKRLEDEIRKIREAEAPRLNVESEWDHTEDFDAEGLWKRCEVSSAKRIERAQKQGRFRVAFDVDRPVAIAAISDQHISPETPVDFRQMREDAELIRDTPDVYAVLGGDACDNHIKHRAAIMAARSQPDDQYRLFEHYLGIFADKIIAVISGNHDAWTNQIGGVDILARVAKAQRVCYAPDEARITVAVGGQDYKVAIRHQYRFNSALNQNHSVKRWFDMGEEPFDCGIVCHHHEAAMESFQRHGRQCWAARPGSYQITSAYSRQFGFNNSVPTCPTFVLFPGRRRIVGFQCVRDAVWAMRGAE